MAVRLSKVFGGSPESWLTQQAHYDLAHLRTTHACKSLFPEEIYVSVGFKADLAIL